MAWGLRGAPGQFGGLGDSGAQDAGGRNSAAGKARAGWRAGLRAGERAGGSRGGVGRGAARGAGGGVPGGTRRAGRGGERAARARGGGGGGEGGGEAGREVAPGLCARATLPGPRNLVRVPVTSWGQRRPRAGHVLRSWGRRDAPRRGVGTRVPGVGLGGRATGSPGMGMKWEGARRRGGSSGGHPALRSHLPRKPPETGLCGGRMCAAEG